MQRYSFSMAQRNLLQTYGYVHSDIQRENDLYTNFFSTSRKTEQCDTPKNIIPTTKYIDLCPTRINDLLECYSRIHLLYLKNTYYDIL